MGRCFFCLSEDFFLSRCFVFAVVEEKNLGRCYVFAEDEYVIFGYFFHTEAWLRVGEERGIFVEVGGTAGGWEGAIFAVSLLWGARPLFLLAMTCHDISISQGILTLCLRSGKPLLRNV